MSDALQRKNEHLSLFEKYYDPNQKNDFDEIRLVPTLIPELNLSEVDPTIDILGSHFLHSFFINAMTGGSSRAKEINSQLATIANKYHLAMAVGSQKIGIIDQNTKDSFSVVREKNPDGFIIANLSANQKIEHVKEAIKMIDANAIQLHLNSIQELVNSEGDRDFHLLNNIENIVNSIEQPVIIKSVGFGINPNDVKRLSDIGVKVFDVSGTGGTNFIKIENQQNKTHHLDYLEELGLSTVESLLAAKKYAVNLIGSGGVRNPLDIIKAHVLGAKLVGISGTFLHPLIKRDPDSLETMITEWIEMIPKIMLMIGTKNLEELKQAPYIPSSKIANSVNFLDKNF
ncbi:type 2 isopentenyl-diphosphate Delta-isomerase [Xylocopilactobacillus apis]|uniref:Isopentenyl-diphosphate delta-isomerase n=1 Tax=Xylocopilactobacillus apis TaxID=2932183 RepID=A0AAU9CQT0_9LACO|nr:type 2 isopentenyl-diphosphate Delta-isomerase [Xylocopilactobacillus apis]BDR56294.1 isopentenyl-diphosphate delta-isomerase [Xylocopilactobacillus apis]